MKKIKLPADSDENTYKYRFDGIGRLILDTQHGIVIIDIRAEDINSFHLENGKRIDILLLDKTTQESS
jgi:hypothetical protein